MAIRATTGRFLRNLAFWAGMMAAVLAVCPSPAAWADSDHDHDRARQALQRGEALPLAEILARLRPQLDGEVVGVSFERKAGRWVYEFKLIAPAGRLTAVYVDAASAQILKQGME